MVRTGVLPVGREQFDFSMAEFFIARPWRRRGLGTLLLLTALSALRERGCPEAVLGVDSDNQSGAVGLYERLGMRTSAITTSGRSAVATWTAC